MTVRALIVDDEAPARSELRYLLQAHSDVNTLQNERDELKQALAKTQTVSVERPNSSAPTKLDETDLFKR